MRNALSLALLSVVLFAAACAPARKFEVTEANLDEIVSAALPFIEEATGTSFPEGVRVVPCTTDEIEAALYEELRAQAALLHEDEETITAQAEAQAASLAPALLAKFRFEDRTVLVSKQAFRYIAELIDEPDLATHDALRGVIVHELVHVAAEERFAFSQVLLSRESLDAMQAYSCIIEGYAQHVARRVTAQLEWNEGFEVFTRAVGALPSSERLEEMGAAMELIVRIRVASIATSYYQGEEFVAAIEEAQGAEGIERVFAAPPVETALIFEPEWYLHPDQRPASLFDLDTGLDAVAGDYPEPEWIRMRVAPTPAQFEVALRALPAALRASVMSSLVQSRVFSALDAESEGGIAVVISLLELGSPAAAAQYLEAHRQLQRIADETMTEGMIRITDATYENLLEPAGLATHKTVESAEEAFDVRALCLVRGSLAVEMVFTETGEDAAALHEVARRVLDGVVRADEAAGEASDPDEDA